MKKIVFILCTLWFNFQATAQQTASSTAAKADNFSDLLKYRNIGPFRGRENASRTLDNQ